MIVFNKGETVCCMGDNFPNRKYECYNRKESFAEVFCVAAVRDLRCKEEFIYCKNEKSVKGGKTFWREEGSSKVRGQFCQAFAVLETNLSWQFFQP